MSNLVETAKQGNPAAISQLINRSLQPKGITAKATIRDQCLKIMLESTPAPPEDLSEYVYKGISNLDIPAIHGLTVYGRNSGDEFPAWTREFNLDAFGEIAAQADQTAAQTAEIHCPRCQSAQVMATKKGFGVGQAAAGALLLGPIGLAGGMIGSNQAMLSCLKCGHQWQPGEKPSKVVLDRSTSARLKKPTPISRVQDALLSFFGFGLLGLILLVIPIIGWVLGPLCLIAAVGCPFMFLFGDENSLTKFVGDCPHCKKPVDVQHEKTELKCPHCQGEIWLKDQRFYAVEK